MQCGTILSCVEEQTSSAAEGGNQPRTYEIICNLPPAGQYPLRPDDRVLSCRAIDMCYCFATAFKYSYCFPIFQIQDTEYDIRRTPQYGPMLSHLYCLMCLLQMCQHQLQDEAAS